MNHLIALILLTWTVPTFAGLYLDWGLGVPLFPQEGYIPDIYGIVGFGYSHPIDDILSVEVGFEHRSITGNDVCNNGECSGDNAIETKLRLEW